MVVFPSWLPFFLYDSSRETHTQRTQSPQDAKQNATHAKSPHIIQNTDFILPISPKWVPPVDRMIFILPTCILTGREALAGREGRAGWVDRKIRANEKMCKIKQNTLN
ncbi:MAG: hypothetical protein IKC51_01380 [Myxococcaceae bacterium]|nr:hypothetical protein [Myxococcaceae bacterium]